MAESSPTASATDAPHPDFGSNEWLVEEMYDQFTADPSSVGDEWADFFRKGGYGSNGGSNGVTESKASPPKSESSETRTDEPALEPTLGVALKVREDIERIVDSGVLEGV